MARVRVRPRGPDTKPTGARACRCSTLSGTRGSGPSWSAAPRGWEPAVAEVVRDAGAEVVVMDRAEVTLEGVKAIQVDLSDKASIEAAMAECGGPVHALFSCAGVADGTPGIERINFLGHRHMIDSMLAADLLPKGSAIGFISSAAGFGWEQNLDPADRVPRHHRLRRGRRVGRGQRQGRLHVEQARHQRSTSPARRWGCSSRASASTPSSPAPPTRRWPRPTPRPWLTFGADYREELGIEASTPLEQAYPLVFLCSDAGGRRHRRHARHRRRVPRLGHERRVPSRRTGAVGFFRSEF